MLTARTIKSWYLVHKWTSLVCTVFMLLLCLTGLPLIFHHEIDHLLGNAPEAPALPEGAPHLSLDRIVDDARSRRPGEAVQFVFQEEDEPDIWGLTMAKTPDAEESTAFYTYDIRTGELLLEYPLRQGFMYYMFEFHTDLFVGLPGALFLGFMGLLLVVSLVSGAVVYGPFMKRLPFGAVRGEISSRTKWLDLHNLLGIVTLAWALVVGFTGVINTLAAPLLAYWQSTELAAMTAPYRDLPPIFPGEYRIQKGIDALKTVEPDMDIAFIAFPQTNFASPHHFAAFMKGDTPLTSKLLKPVLLDARNGDVAVSGELPWYLTALLISQPLHFGDYGGMPMKIIWTALDVITIIVLGSGLYLWLARRKSPVEARIEELERQERRPAEGEVG
ncbi:MAG: PepSY-associated TM helix domain-containing protein [Deltaproteobacteria bacterium]